MSDTQALTTTQHQGDGAMMRQSRQLPSAHVDEMVQQVRTIQEIMEEVMQEDSHYGTIPGTQKPTLLKPGAEKLSMAFRLAPEYERVRTDLDDGHREYEVTCRLIHIPTGQFYGEGVGSCSTLESKYRYRNAKLSCPECGEETVIKGKEEYGGGWLCWKKKGGCGAKWDDGAAAIEDQERGKVENPDIADVYNTVLKMAKKRAHVDAVLTATAASDIFTQDLEDMPLAGNPASAVGGAAARQPSAQKQARPQQPHQQVVQKPNDRSAEAERAAKVNKLIDQMIERLTGLPDEERGAELERIAEYIEDWPADERRRVVETLQEEELLLPPDRAAATRGDKRLFFADDAF